MPKHGDFSVQGHSHSNGPVKVTKLRVRENKASDLAMYKVVGDK